MSIMLMIYNNIDMMNDGEKRDMALEQGFRALCKWLNQTLTVTHQLPWVTYKCKECTSEVTRHVKYSYGTIVVETRVRTQKDTIWLGVQGPLRKLLLGKQHPYLRI